MKWVQRELDTVLHMLMSVAGGFFGGYAIFLSQGHFASAQTANLIGLVIDALQGSWPEMALRAGALLVYVASLAAAALVPHYVKGDMRCICILVELAGVAVLYAVPLNVSSLAALYPVFALTAFQWGTFHGARGFNCSTIFSTNNLKQAVDGCVEWIRTREKRQKEKCLFYGGTLLCFHLGVAAGCGAALRWQKDGIWALGLPLLLALALWLAGKKFTSSGNACASEDPESASGSGGFPA